MHDIVIADWKDVDGFIEQMKEVLSGMGIHVYDDPGAQGSDNYGVIISDSELGEEEIDVISKEFWESGYEDEDEDEETSDDFDFFEDETEELNEATMIMGPGPGKRISETEPHNDFKKAAEIDNATEDSCPTCHTPYEDWELIDGLWTCPGCGYEVGEDEF